jgi:hypothetical protein
VGQQKQLKPLKAEIAEMTMETMVMTVTMKAEKTQIQTLILIHNKQLMTGQQTRHRERSNHACETSTQTESMV